MPDIAAGDEVGPFGPRSNMFSVLTTELMSGDSLSSFARARGWVLDAADVPAAELWANLAGILLALIKEANDGFFGFDLVGVVPVDPPRVVVATPGDPEALTQPVFERHGSTRKVGVSLVLASDGVSGGLGFPGGIGKGALGPGHATVFPALLPLRRRPPSTGPFVTFEAWIHGPEFR